MGQSDPNKAYIITEAEANHNNEGDPAAQAASEQRKYWKFFGIPKYDISMILGLYIISHIYILLLGNSVFWDDWVIFNTSTEILIEKFQQVGAPFSWTGYLHAALFSIGPWIYKPLTFIVYFLTGISLLKIMERQRGPWVNDRVIIVVLFMILPLNSARVAAINFPYALCYFSFFLGWWMLDKHRLIASLLFLFSFNTNSLLPFFAIPIADYVLRNYKKQEIFNLNAAKENLGLLCLPFLYFGIKQLFFKPSGLYESYNSQFSLGNIPIAARIQLSEIYALISNQSEKNLFLFLFAMVLLTIALYRPVSKIAAKNHVAVRSASIKLTTSAIFIGCVLIAVAEFPYLILGHAPTFNNWSSRHQLLMPMGAAIFLYGIIFQFGGLSRNVVVSCVISFCVVCNIILYWEYYVDWQKHKEIIRAISDQDVIRKGRLIVFEDHTGIKNARGRTNSFYEWSGMLTYAYGDEKRFGVDQKEWSRNFCFPDHVAFSPHYKTGKIKSAESKNVVLVKIFKEDDISKSVFGRLKSLIYPKLRLAIEDNMPYCKSY